MASVELCGLLCVSEERISFSLPYDLFVFLWFIYAGDFTGVLGSVENGLRLLVASVGFFHRLEDLLSFGRHWHRSSPFSVILISAYSAPPPVGVTTDDRIFRTVFMPPGTMRFASVFQSGVTTIDVHFGSDRLQMIRIHAMTDSAQMIKT
jgi:hypothetical protein